MLRALGEVTFTGASGHQYTFVACSYDSDFPERYPAVYFVTRRAPVNERSRGHSNIFVGHTPDLRNQLQQHREAGVFKRLGANCVCVYPATSESERRRIEFDLYENYVPPANRRPARGTV